MYTAIHFNNEFFLCTVEIHNVWPERHLPSEFHIVETTRSEFSPEKFFHHRLLGTENPGERESFGQTFCGFCSTHGGISLQDIAPNPHPALPLLRGREYCFLQKFYCRSCNRVFITPYGSFVSRLKFRNPTSVKERPGLPATAPEFVRRRRRVK